MPFSARCKLVSGCFDMYCFTKFYQFVNKFRTYYTFDYLFKGEGRTLDGSDNVFCGPFPTVVAVDPVNHNVFPYYVTLHRCQGSNGLTQPSLKKCLPANYTEIRVKTNKGTDITLKNHTKCEPGCAKSSADCDSNSLQHFNSNNCVCDCRHKTSPLRPCGHNHE